ncbi:MAG: hypothetical protein Fur0041_18740 [Bacteroidia bacterium]
MRFFIIALGIFLISASAKNPCPALDSNGIFVYKIDQESSAVIRFYPDGIVLVSTSINDYSKVLTWFNRDPENESRVLKGKYFVKPGKPSCSIRFNVEGETGKQKYKGVIIDNSTLQLSIYNPGDHTSAQRTYKFIKP